MRDVSLSRSLPALLAAALVALSLLGEPVPAEGQEARERWERLGTIRAEKFDVVLPEAMRRHGIDMWITVMKENGLDPLWEDLGRGYVPGTAYYIFTDGGEDRIERVAVGVGGYMLERCGVYDQVVGGDFDLRAFVQEREPARIGVNMSHELGAADGLSYSNHQALVETLGEPWASRLVSAEELISWFRSERVPSELAAFAQVAEITRSLEERALSREVITPGMTRLEDVAWWLWDRLLERGMGSSFDMPSVYVTGPGGIEAVSTERIIQGGDLLMIDFGVCHLNLCTDIKRIAYVLPPGETAPPPGIQHAFDRALEAGRVIRESIRPGRTGLQAMALIDEGLASEGFRPIPFNQPTDEEVTDVSVVMHSVGNTGHGIGPSIDPLGPPILNTLALRPSNLLSFEYFAYTPVPEWDGAKVRIPIEENVVVTDRGVELLYPFISRIRLIP